MAVIHSIIPISFKLTKNIVLAMVHSGDPQPSSKTDLTKKLMQATPEKKNTKALTTKPSVSQKASKAPDSSTLADMSHFEVAPPYSPNTATDTTPVIFLGRAWCVRV